MELKCTVNPYIPATRQRHLVYALIEVEPGRDEALHAPTPINLGLIVDASRSMEIPILSDAQFEQLKRMGMARRVTVDGVQVWQFEVPKRLFQPPGFQIEAPSNMDFTKEALRVVADRLHDDDRFSLVAFAEDALLMVGHTAGSQRDALRAAAARLDDVDLGDETYMARGMEMGCQQMEPGISPGRVSRMVVLTDGYTKDASDCYRWTRYAKKNGVVVTTMGLGLDFNEDLLISLADVSGGHAYFIQDPQEIPAAFQQELAGAQSVTWRDLSLALHMPDDVALRRAHRVRPAIATLDAHDNSLALGDLEAGQPPAVLLELIVPPRPAGTYRLAQVTLRGRPAGSSASQQAANQDVLAQYTETPSLAVRTSSPQTNAHLMSIVQRVSVFKLQNQAMEEAQALAAQGNLAGATRRLRTAGERLIEMGQEDLGQTMLVEAELMEKEGQMSAQGTKKLRYGTRKLK